MQLLISLLNFCFFSLILAIVGNSISLGQIVLGPVDDTSVETSVDSDFFRNSNKTASNPSSTASKSSASKKPESLEKRLKNLGRLYEDEDNPVIQELWFLGRYHGQYYDAAGNVGASNAWEDRRFRIGSQAQLFEKLTLHAQMVSGSDFQPFYNGFTELWWQWSFDDSLRFTVGQQKHRFTHDRNVSSRYLNTLERSMLVNMFNADYTPAITLSGQAESVTYYTGIFSNATGPDMWRAFTEYDSGYSLLSSVTGELGTALGTDAADLNFCYVYSDANQNATNLNRFRNGISAALILTQGTGALVSEALIGLQSENGDAYGVNIQPSYFLTEKLQLATRYQGAFSSDNVGLFPQRRYERPSGLTNGEVYQAGYAGLNYYIAGHRIKLMHGLEFADMSGQNLWTASVAVRVFWGPNARGPFPITSLLESD